MEAGEAGGKMVVVMDSVQAANTTSGQLISRQKDMTMGLAWQQGPLATGSIGHFLTEQPMP